MIAILDPGDRLRAPRADRRTCCEHPGSSRARPGREHPRAAEAARSGRGGAGNWVVGIYSIVALLIMLVPIGYTIAFSFNDSRRSNIVWRGFTLDNWLNVCDDERRLRVVRQQHPRRRLATAGRHDPRHHDRDRHRALHLPAAHPRQRAAVPADGHPRGGARIRARIPVRQHGRRAGPVVDHRRPHHVLHQLRRGDRASPRGQPRPVARGSGP